MRKNYLLLGASAFFLILLSSCKSDDNSYTPLAIETSPDVAQVFQNISLEVDVLANDTNVPSNGTLTVSAPQTGSVTVLDPNNTPGNPADDIVQYTPDNTFLGQDTFQYTICEGGTSNCATETVTMTVLQASPVNFNIDEIPYPVLSDYNFFDGPMANQDPVYGVLPYKPINKLFSDYALKKRFIWMPMGVTSTYTEDFEVISSPNSTVLVKTFYYDNVQPGNNTQIIETRLMIKKDGVWIFANYLWNEDQTEAVLDASGNGGFVEVEWIQDGETKNVNYRIPAQSECYTCHKNSAENIPLGLKPQNLNSDYAYPEGTMNQLQKFREMGYLNSVPGSIVTVPDWTDTSLSLRERVRGYVDINCSGCHSEGGHCDYRFLRFSYFESDNNRNIGICETPDTPVPGFDKIIDRGNLDNSVLHFRLATTEEQYRMPLLGRRLVHEEGLDLIEEWINSMSEPCN